LCYNDQKLTKKYMDKIAIAILVILAVITGLGLLIYFGEIKIPETIFGQNNSPQETITPLPSPDSDSDIEGVLPALQPNALENKPDINPMNAANPIGDIKINPFE